MLAANVPEYAEPAVIDLYMDDSPEDQIGIIIRNSPSVIGFSVYLWNVKRVLILAETLNRTHPEIHVIAGGPEVTADPKKFIETGLFNALFTGEGEKNIKVYLEAVKSGGNAGKIYRQTTPLDMESLESPFLNGTINPAEYDGILWEFSRGCIFNCSFCFESRGIKKVRGFKTERIRNELELFKKAGVSQVFVLDPTFNLDRERAKSILRLIKKTAPDIHFTFEIRSEFLDRETAELFSEITCSVQIGLQSADNSVLKNVNRSIDRDDFYEKILLLHEEGAVYGFDLIYGLPGDSYSGFKDSLDFALSLRPNHLDIFPLAVLKGTELYGDAAAFNLKWNRNDPYTVTGTPDFPPEDMKKARKLAEACDLFYNKGEAVPWFHMILDELDIFPSQLLELFVSWKLEKQQIPSGLLEISEFIAEFLRDIFKRFDLEKEGKAAGDIVMWMNGTSYLLETPEINSVILNFFLDIAAMADNMEMGIDSLEELSHFSEPGPYRGELIKTGSEVILRIIES